jgi:hypothetical protein
MFEKITGILKWVLIPALIAVALLSCMAGRYEGLLDLTICMSAAVLVPRAAWLKEYGWAAVWVVAVVVFSPLFLATKIFLLMGLTCFATCLMVLTAFRPQPVATS